MPYCLILNLDSDYLGQFEPEAEGISEYSSYSDFFRRRLKNPIKTQSQAIWPCEGYVCDWGNFEEKSRSMIKGQWINLQDVFVKNGESNIPSNYFFVNIFLHNHNYHRVHAPISGTIKNISNIPGDLVFLRPWFYKKSDVTYPALRNERLTIEIEDTDKKMWYITLVGGFGVGSIIIEPASQIGSMIHIGDEIAHFRLGSTVCIASPYIHTDLEYLKTVSVGDIYKSTPLFI